MKINDQRKCSQQPPQMFMRDIPVGTVFTGKIGGYADDLFLRTHGEIVSLRDPDKTWAEVNCPVRNFEPVAAELTIRDT